MAEASSLAELEALIAQERAAVHALIDERVVPLMVRRRVLAMGMAEARTDRKAAPRRVRGAAPRRGARHTASETPWTGKIPTMEGKDVPLSASLRLSHAWPSGRIVMCELERGPDEGVQGRVINARLLGWGHALDTAERTKTRLRHLGAVTHDKSTGLWRMTPEYRSSVPHDAPIEIDQADRGHASDPTEQTGGRIILDALAAGPSAGMAREALVMAVIAAGFSRSLGRHAHGALDMAGVIVRGDARDTWRISPSGTQGR